MKLRVIIQGLVICTVVWAMVFAAQGYFRSLRLTAATVEEVIEDADLADWSDGVPEPDPGRVEERREKINQIAELLGKLDFEEGDRARERKVASRFFEKLSPDEKNVFVQLAIRSKLELYMTAFDGLDAEKREKFLKKTRKELEFGNEDIENDPRLKMLDHYWDRLIADGVRTTLEGMTTEEVMEFSESMQIMKELMQRMRMPNWEGRGGD